MKLYATVSSERATKGQGGNEFLTVNIFDGQKVCHGSIDIRPDLSMDIRYRGVKYTIDGATHTEKVLSKNGFVPEALTANDGSKFIGWSKKKPRTKYCTGCGACTMGEGWEDGKCDTCYEKGEKQKGEYHKCKKHEERTRECKFYSFQNDPCSEI